VHPTDRTGLETPDEAGLLPVRPSRRVVWETPGCIAARDAGLGSQVQHARPPTATPIIAMLAELRYCTRSDFDFWCNLFDHRTQ
jgi:hypothetical protein